jgi:hypothetical protein
MGLEGQLTAHPLFTPQGEVYEAIFHGGKMVIARERFLFFEP